jgi:cell division septum initiation protein DivIVA
MADADTDAKPVDQDTLVADIESTRTQLARTIDAIADRVSPKKNVERTMEQARRRADEVTEQTRRRAEEAIEQARRQADQAMEQARRRADQAMEQFRQHAGQVDPIVAGAAAAAVAVGVTALFLWRRRGR